MRYLGLHIHAHARTHTYVGHGNRKRTMGVKKEVKSRGGGDKGG